MQAILALRLKPEEAASEAAIKQAIGAELGQPAANVSGFHLRKRSIDARSRQQVWINLSVTAFVNEPFAPFAPARINYPNVAVAKHQVVVVGAGPAGLFAALQLMQLGVKPIVLERGKDVRSRRRDLAAMNKAGEVNPESNYCFGEGGAGTYSDGKLYTRSNKRGSIEEVLNTFVQFGADEKILYESHPHIGTNKLPQIIQAMRQQVVDGGGQVLFDTKLTGLKLQNGKLSSILVNDGGELPCQAMILATGHSARDIFQLLHQHHILVEAKPFALGVRIEHPQTLIDQIQYKSPLRSEWLPPASYSLVEQVAGKGVFSFCMCPGGIIAPASTAPGELVVNGWSPSRRNNPHSNSGMVVTVDMADAQAWQASRHYAARNRPNPAFDGPLGLLAFQQAVEQDCWVAGGGQLVAPAQRMIDFCSNKRSPNLPDCSYLPGLASAPVHQTLPPFVAERLQQAFRAFGQKMRGYYTNEAVVVATESRTSSPVRIPRNEAGQHPQVANLFPCGEGAGYAGGIVSAAMDGQFCARQAAALVMA